MNFIDKSTLKWKSLLKNYNLKYERSIKSTKELQDSDYHYTIFEH